MEEVVEHGSVEMTKLYYAEFLRKEYSPRNCLAVTILTAVYVAAAIYKLSHASHMPAAYVYCMGDTPDCRGDESWSHLEEQI
jgi:hypothetical protein